MLVKTAEFIKSASTVTTLPPPGIPEFAFIGRSNVGKSSLMNMLLGRKNLVKTSKTPGKTTTLNYFMINNAFYFVDLPGYGYAKRSKSEQQSWRQTIEMYLKSRRSLTDVFLLIDARHGVQSSDEMMMDFLAHFDIPYKTVLTKTDKLTKNECQALRMKFTGHIMASAVSGEGKEVIWQCIEQYL